MASMQCQRCKVIKDETDFHWKWKDIERLKICKECRKVDSRRYRDKSTEKRLAYNREYISKNRDRHLEYQRNYYATHEEERKEYKARNAERIAENRAIDYRNNIEKNKKHLAEWIANNRDKTRQYPKKHRALKNGAEITDFTSEQWNDILVEHDYRCAYCGRCECDLEQDHIVPVSRGGNHTKSNIVPACKPCNSSKKDKLLANWKKTLYFRENCDLCKL